jgi:hypothetical protein
MANPEHLKILKKRVKAWRVSRYERIPKYIDLSGADLSRINLSGAILGNVNLDKADLSGADLSDTELSGPSPFRLSLSGANLNGADLSGADLLCADLSGADLGGADFSGANLGSADLSGASLIGADLGCADLSGANLNNANLSEADLKCTNLLGVTLNNKTNFDKAKMGATILGDIDLSGVIGLDEVLHKWPSTIGVDTIYKSQGKISDKFLLDAGVPEEIIEIARSIRAGPPIQWHSCFISYSTKEEEFARRLHSRMRAANMRVWFAPEDLKGGKKLHEQLFEAIQIYDRLLIVLSEHSIQSEWVMTEIRKARETEKKERRRKLFPIRLTGFETLRDWTCFDADTGKDLAVEVREYFIPDFSNWKDHDAFESAFAKLKRDLEAENSKK